MESKASDDVKLVFIREALEEHGQWLRDLLAEEVEKKRLVQSGELAASVATAPVGDDRAPGVGFAFATHGRFVDINAYKVNRHKVDAKEIAWGMKANKVNRKGAKVKWYAKNQYQGYYKLVSKIMYGLSEHEIERIKKTLQGNG